MLHVISSSPATSFKMWGYYKNIFLTNATYFLLRWSSEGRAFTFPLTEWTPFSPSAASISQRSGSRPENKRKSSLPRLFLKKIYADQYEFEPAKNLIPKLVNYLCQDIFIFIFITTFFLCFDFDFAF